MTLTFRGIIVLLMYSFANPLMADGQFESFDCPESIDVTETVSGVAPGWEATLDRGRHGYLLENVGFYDGHPSQMASLVPDATKQTGNVRKSIWRFAKAATSGYWIACSYQNTRMLVTKKLPADAKMCQVDEELLASGAVLKIKAIDCQ